MAHTSVEELIERLQDGAEPLSSIAPQLESAASQLGNAQAAALVHQELEGYGTDTPTAELTKAARKSDVLGRMKLNALETRLDVARAKAAAVSADAAGTLERIRFESEAKQLEQLLAERRTFLLGIARSLQPKPGQHWVWSIHGILTRGVWQKDLVPLLADAQFKPFLFDYKWYDPVRMLFPGSRHKKIDAFRDKYGEFTQIHKGVVPSIIAHSMGSYIVTWAIEKYGLHFDRVILCGAIVREDYPWDEMIRLGRVRRVLHDYGRQDIWARLVVWFVGDAGQSGYNGFEQTAGGAVQQRRHRYFKHSDYFYPTNFLERWIPFLKGADPPEMPAEPAARVNWKFRMVAAVVIAAVAYAIWKYF
jgi:pimeloyl-ACP methyl ester carboxylesterase